MLKLLGIPLLVLGGALLCAAPKADAEVRVNVQIEGPVYRHPVYPYADQYPASRYVVPDNHGRDHDRRELRERDRRDREDRHDRDYRGEHDRNRDERR